MGSAPPLTRKSSAAAVEIEPEPRFTVPPTVDRLIPRPVLPDELVLEKPAPAKVVPVASIAGPPVALTVPPPTLSVPALEAKSPVPLLVVIASEPKAVVPELDCRCTPVPLEPPLPTV